MLVRLRRRSLGRYSGFPLPTSRRHCCAWRLAGLFCGAGSVALPRGEPALSLPKGVPAPRETEWCERWLLARIHRLTVGMLRKQIEPVTAAAFMRWLLRWQHVAPGTQVAGERGTLEVVQQLQGFEIPANAWERQVLARRIADY